MKEDPLQGIFLEQFHHKLNERRIGMLPAYKIHRQDGI